ncbi:MAG: hypothetical protein AAFR46_01655 [Pseudomonadota bacterium]
MSRFRSCAIGFCTAFFGLAGIAAQADRADFVGLMGQCKDDPEERCDGTHN